MENERHLGFNETRESSSGIAERHEIRGPGTDGIYHYRGAGIELSSAGTRRWWATVRFRNQEKDFEARSSEEALEKAKDWIDAAPEHPRETREKNSARRPADAGHLERFSRPEEARRAGEVQEAHRDSADEHAARELVLYIENTSELSPDGPHGQGRSVLLNALRKWRKGTYDPALGVKLFAYLAEAGAKKYAKEFGSSEREWSMMFNPATRHEAAKQLEESFRNSAEHGEYDHVDTRVAVGNHETREGTVAAGRRRREPPWEPQVGRLTPRQIQDFRNGFFEGYREGSHGETAIKGRAPSTEYAEGARQGLIAGAQRENRASRERIIAAWITENGGADNHPGHRHLEVHRVSDFNTLDDLIAHARDELGATHVIPDGPGTTLYFPRRGTHSYEEARVWRKGGYWHAEGPGARRGVSRLPAEARPIGGGESGQRAAEVQGGATVNDDNPFYIVQGLYSDAKSAAGTAGVVQFVRPNTVSEAHQGGRYTSGVHFQQGDRVRIRVIGPQGQLFDPPFWYTVDYPISLEELALRFTQTIQPGMFVSISDGKNSWTFQKETHAGQNAIRRTHKLPTGRTAKSAPKPRETRRPKAKRSARRRR